MTRRPKKAEQFQVVCAKFPNPEDQGFFDRTADSTSLFARQQGTCGEFAEPAQREVGGIKSTALSCALSAKPALIGAINALAVAAVRIPPIITTLATLFAYDGLALVLTGGINIDLTQSPAAFLAIGQGQVSGIPFQLLFLYLPMLAAFIHAQHGTRFGRELYLAGSSTLAANLAGLRVDRLRGATYVVAGLVSGIAGIVDAAWLGTARPDAAENANLISIAIVVLGGTGIFGGTGSVIGTALATVVIAIIDNGLSYSNVNPIYQAGVIGVILLATILAENLVASIRARAATAVRPSRYSTK